MSSQPTRVRKRDRIKAFFLHGTLHPESLPAVPGSPSSSKEEGQDAPGASSSADGSKKVFTKGKSFERDIAILSATYVLNESSELKDLIKLVILIRDKDDVGQFNDVLEIFAHLCIDLASAPETRRPEVIDATKALTKVIEEVRDAQLAGNAEAIKALKGTVDKEVAEVKSQYPLVLHGSDARNPEGLTQVIDLTIGASISVLDFINEASAIIPVPLVQPIVEKVVTVLKAVAQTRSNYSDMKELAATAGEFAVTCAVHCSDPAKEPSIDLKRALNKFTKTLGDIAEECDELSHFNPFWRYIKQEANKDDLQALSGKLDGAIKLFQTESHIAIQLDISDLSRKFDLATLASLPSHPHYAQTDYLEGSRDDVIGFVSEWLDKPNELILWLHGAAGLGKSTVVQQLVHLLKSDQRLAGAVYLRALASERPETVIQMISRQLGEMHSRAVPSIAEGARNLNGPHDALADYFATYLLHPISALKYPYPLVVVIDGLDEWTNRESFLSELTKLPLLPNLRLILTSRPNQSIERYLNKAQTRPYPLPPVSDEVIETYLVRGFEIIDWKGRKPDRLTIQQLASRAHGLLVWAATVRSLLTQEFEDRYPHAIIDQILASEEKIGSRSGEQLEQLYSDALANLFPEKNMQEKFRDFLGAMIVLQETLPLADFAYLIGMSDRPAGEVQRRLLALRTRSGPTTDTVEPAVMQFHASFLEFVQATSLQEFSVQITEVHSKLYKRCLKIVFSDFLLSYRGQCGLYSDLRGAELYAIRYWPLHLSLGLRRPQPEELHFQDVSDAALRRWAAIYLPCISERFRGQELKLEAAGQPVLYQVAKAIGAEDPTTMKYHVSCLEVGVKMSPRSAAIWKDLGGSYLRMYKLSNDMRDLDESIAVFRRALELVSENITAIDKNHDEDRSSILERIAFALQLRFDQLGGQSDHSESVSLYQELLGIWMENHANRSMALTGLAIALKMRFDLLNAESDITNSISLHREALLLRSAPHPNRFESLNSLGNSLQSRFKHYNNMSDLEEAISLHRQALELCPGLSGERAASLDYLANSLQTRFKQRGLAVDLEEAIMLQREALTLIPSHHPDRLFSVANLASCLDDRFDLNSDPRDIAEAIDLHRETVALCPSNNPKRPTVLANLAASLQIRFGSLDDPEDLSEAISLLQEALVLCPYPHPERPYTLNTLASALQNRFGLSRSERDINDAVLYYREALGLRPAPHVSRSIAVNNLAVALRTRYTAQNTTSDLDEALLLFREGVALCPAPHPSRYAALGSLAKTLGYRFEAFGTASDLDEAIVIFEEAISQTESSQQDPWLLSNFARVLQHRFDALGLLSDIDKVVIHLQEVVNLSSPRDPDLVATLQQLADALLSRFDKQGTSGDLDESISTYRKVLALLPLSHPDHFKCQHFLVSALLIRSDRGSNPSDFMEALALEEVSYTV